MNFHPKMQNSSGKTKKTACFNDFYLVVELDDGTEFYFLSVF